MYSDTSGLILYSNISKSGSIISELSDIIEEIEFTDKVTGSTRKRFFEQINRLLNVATNNGFDDNLWQNYLTYLLMTDENPFSTTCEKQGSQDGSVNELVKSDFAVFIRLFHYDFKKIEEKLGSNCFDVINNYKAVRKTELMYNRDISKRIRELSRKLSSTTDVDEFFNIITGFYKDYGVGKFGLNKAFRIVPRDISGYDIVPITNMDRVVLSDLIGYEHQKKQLVDNTKAFVEGRKANNVLLYGDSGTGKSTSIKAVLNEFYDEGLRMIELYKHQLKYLSSVISVIKKRNYKYIIYMDDLSFEDNEVEYKYLKAIIEGGMETRPDNILIYATSNRRNLIKETWKDRNDMEYKDDIHHSDTIEEKMSLVNRFGVKINYSKPTPTEFKNIVEKLAEREDLHISKEELIRKANVWEIRHGGISGRTAQQFINSLIGSEPEEDK